MGSLEDEVRKQEAEERAARSRDEWYSAMRITRGRRASVLDPGEAGLWAEFQKLVARDQGQNYGWWIPHPTEGRFWVHQGWEAVAMGKHTIPEPRWDPGPNWRFTESPGAERWRMFWNMRRRRAYSAEGDALMAQYHREIMEVRGMWAQLGTPARCWTLRGWAWDPAGEGWSKETEMHIAFGSNQFIGGLGEAGPLKNALVAALREVRHSS